MNAIMERNIVAGVTTIQIILGHRIARIVSMVDNVAILFLVALYLFDVPMRGNPLVAFALLFNISIAGNQII